MIERYFSINMPIWRFSFNTLVVSCAGLFPLLVIYIALTPAFAPLLLNNQMALSRFLREVVTNGLPVVFTVNYLSFFLYAVRADGRGGEDALASILLIDPPLRVGIFILLHGLIYFFSADWFGSFGGDHWLALRVVAPTLTRSALFANLSGVYFYATLGSALPVYTTVIEPLLARPAVRRTWFGPLAQMMPGRSAAILLALILFAASALLLTALTMAIEYLQPSYSQRQSP